MTPGRPNILFLLTDQQRFDALGCTGGRVRTPHVDSLAAEGVVFEHVYANSCECVPARFSLATGLYPHQTGVDRNRNATLDPRTPTWSSIVAAAGYRTSVIGKTHLHPHEGDLRDRAHLLHEQGFEHVDEVTGPRASAEAMSGMTSAWDEVGLLDAYREDVRDRFATNPRLVRPSPLPVDLYYDVFVGRRACDYLAALEPGSPWACWVSFPGPHEPWDAPEPYASMYDPETMAPPLPRIGGEWHGGLLQRCVESGKHSPDLPAEDVAAMRANYAGSVTLIDDQIGKILDVVRARGEWERTLVIFTSDHGEMNGDHGFVYKSNFLDPSVRVPLVVRPPGGTEARHVDALVELMDVAATIAATAEPGASLGHARPLVDVMEGGAEHRDVVHAEYDGHTMHVDGSWKAEITPDGHVSMLVDRVRDPDEATSVVVPETAAVQEGILSAVEAFVAATPPPTQPVALAE